MKIYTKTGDKGETSLIGGTRVPKNSERIESYGTVDELNSLIGVVMNYVDQSTYSDLLLIQSDLFSLGAELANPKVDKSFLNIEKIQRLEVSIDKMTSKCKPQQYFILPSGSLGVSHCHVARTVCRRAERRILSLAATTEIDPLILQYCNRLSDYLFTLSRYIATSDGIEENEWIPEKK